MKNITLSVASAALLVTTALFTGCASSSTSISTPVKKEYSKKYESFTLEEKTLGKNAPQEKKTLFENKLKDVFQKYDYKNSSGLKIEYSFIAYDEGNQALRYFVGFGAGEGTLKVKTTFIDSSTNEVLGSIQTDGKLTMGAFGGDFDGAIDKVANDIFEFAKNNYMVFKEAPKIEPKVESEI